MCIFLSLFLNKKKNKQKSMCINKVLSCTPNELCEWYISKCQVQYWTWLFALTKLKFTNICARLKGEQFEWIRLSNLRCCNLFDSFSRCFDAIVWQKLWIFFFLIFFQTKPCCSVCVIRYDFNRKQTWLELCVSTENTTRMVHMQMLTSCLKFRSIF